VLDLDDRDQCAPADSDDGQVGLNIALEVPK
jgi:hypothetical protein